MNLFLKNYKEKIGKPPGTLVYTGNKKEVKTKIDHILYDRETLNQNKNVSLEELHNLVDPQKVNWINVVGINDAHFIRSLGSKFDIDNMVLEDIMNINSLPKVEFVESGIFVTMKMLFPVDKNNKILSEQISIYLKGETLFLFQEAEGDIFNALRFRLENSLGNARKSKSDYLLFALMDIVVDQYFAIISDFSEKIEVIEDKLLREERTDLLYHILEIKKTLRIFHLSFGNLDENMNKFFKYGDKLIEKNNLNFFQDISDHLKFVLSEIGSLKEIVGGLTDIHLSNENTQMNKVMKRLTMIATVFIPLTFLAGLYGMNFTHMPELEWQYSYPILLVIMLITGFGFFKYLKNSDEFKK